MAVFINYHQFSCPVWALEAQIGVRFGRTDNVGGRRRLDVCLSTPSGVAAALYFGWAHHHKLQQRVT